MSILCLVVFLSHFKYIINFVLMLHDRLYIYVVGFETKLGLVRYLVHDLLWVKVYVMYICLLQKNDS